MTSCPCLVQCLATSLVNISAPPAAGLNQQRQLKIRNFDACQLRAKMCFLARMTAMTATAIITAPMPAMRYTGIVDGSLWGVIVSSCISVVGRTSHQHQTA